GTVPAVHGLVSNSWADANNSRLVNCTDDETKSLISYGAPAKGIGQSAAKLLSPTFSDELRAQTWPPPRVVSFSLKARSAINLAGHKPDIAVWLDEGDGEWVTSTAFATAPAPFLAEYIAKHPIKELFNRKWERALPKDQYLYEGTPEFRRRTP